MNYIFIAATVFFGVLLTLFARNVILWLEAKAKETNTKWDDTAERFTAEGIEIPFPEREDWFKK